MYVHSVSLKDFKNYVDQSVQFGEGVNVIFGDNAAGKTNLLESVFIFAAGKSFRNSKDKDFIRFGSDFCKAYMEFSDCNGKQNMEIRFVKNQKRKIFRNNAEIQRLSEYLGVFRAVIFTPDHLNLVKGSPEFRRRFIDMAICQSFPRYVAGAGEYNKLIIQKNALLRGKINSDEMLDVYNEKIAALAAVITLNRMKYLKKLEESAKLFHSEITEGKETLALSYSPQAGGGKTEAAEIKDKYLELLEEKKEVEKQRGMALYGPHKDDFCISINGKNSRVYASQGQQRSAVLSLKLAEGELSKQLTGEYPVFLLDDILSELDGGRRGYILEKIKGKQVIITGCEKEFFRESDISGKIFIKEGQICSCI